MKSKTLVSYEIDFMSVFPFQNAFKKKKQQKQSQRCTWKSFTFKFQSVFEQKKRKKKQKKKKHSSKRELYKLIRWKLIPKISDYFLNQSTFWMIDWQLVWH